MSESELVLVARIVRPQGRRGEVLAEILTDFPERFGERRRLWLVSDEAGVSARAVELESHWLHKGRVVLKFAGVDSIEAAEPLRGLGVAIGAAERAPLDPEAVYIADLIGCRLLDEGAGGVTDVGEITGVERQAVAADLLVVQTGEGEELLVPFAKAYLRRVDLATKQVAMALPEGLTGINAPMTAAERAELGDSAGDVGAGE
jgi:16S rRNA processing protein RimM